jgi:predicted  nucleic acid-binding Zn-ribbon protein
LVCAKDSDDYRALTRSYEITQQQLEAERRQVERLNKSLEGMRVELINTRNETERITREVTAHESLFSVQQMDDKRYGCR